MSQPQSQPSHAPCPICRATAWAVQLPGVVDYITEERFGLLRCGSCGLVVTHPTPVDMDHYYPPRYRTDRQKQTGRWRVRRRATMLQTHFPRHFRGRLLDLGCGTGAFALEMQRRGWTVAVTELNDAVLADLRERGIEAKRPDEALRDGFSIGPFDAVVAWHVLEHVPDPVLLARWSAENLAPGGVFQATVPNLASFQARAFGPYWLHLDVPRHWYHFTPDTLRVVLDGAGLRQFSLTTVALEYDLFGVMQSILNMICSRPNVLFERLTTRQKLADVPRRDVILSFALAPPVGMYAVAHCTLAALCRGGATLTVTCRRQGRR
jgi:SAM-dependent methyltransferase